MYVDRFHHMQGHDPIHPDDHGPPLHDDVEFPSEDVDDSGEQDDDYGMNDPPMMDPPSGGQPPTFPPYPPPSNPPVVNVPVQPQSQFDNPDETIEQVTQPVADEDSSSEDRTLTEPIRLKLTQRHVSHMIRMINHRRLRLRRQRYRWRNRRFSFLDISKPLYRRQWRHRRLKMKNQIQLLAQTILLFLFRQQHRILLHHHQRFLKTPQIMVYTSVRKSRDNSVSWSGRWNRRTCLEWRRNWTSSIGRFRVYTTVWIGNCAIWWRLFCTVLLRQIGSVRFSILWCKRFPEVLPVLSQEWKEDTQIGSCDYSSDSTAVC